MPASPHASLVAASTPSSHHCSQGPESAALSSLCYHNPIVGSMVSSYNPACYLPQSWSSYIPSAISCPPPPSYAAQLYNYATLPFSSTYKTLRTMMDAIVGLPVLSFLLIPTMSSYSTSLNILFFYLTWSTLVLSHPPLKVEIIATL